MRHLPRHLPSNPLAVSRAATRAVMLGVLLLVVAVAAACAEAPKNEAVPNRPGRLLSRAGDVAQPAPATPAPATPAPTTPAPTTPAPTTPAPTTPSAPPSGFPTPATTGWQPTGVSLTAYTGPTNITTPGTVIDSKDITSCLRISARNVTIKRSRITCSGDFAILQPDNNTPGLVVEDTEIRSTSRSSRVDWGLATWGNGATLSRLYVHDTQRGWALGSNTVLQDSYIGQNYNPTENHAQAILSSGGSQHVVIRNNTLRCEENQFCTSAISIFPELWAGGANDDFLIDGNLLAGGSYCAYLGHTPSGGESPNTNMRFVNNRFDTSIYSGCGSYGPLASWSTGATGNLWSNNTWNGGTKSGQPVNP
jgi:hypothetical protein